MREIGGTGKGGGRDGEKTERRGVRVDDYGTSILTHFPSTALKMV